MASRKDFLTKYWKVIRVYTINANRGDQNPLDITLRQRAPFSNVFILDNVRSAQTMDQSMPALPVTSRVNIVWTVPFLPQNVVAALRLVPRIKTGLKFWDKSLRLFPQKASCKLFVGLVPATSPFE